jgi:hypothetical protein
MNFQELMARIAELDKPVVEADKGDMDHDGVDEPDSKEYLDNKDAAIKKATGKKEESIDLLADELEQDMDECGMGPMSMPSMNKQQDNVSMNVSMNGSGSGGIRDLMNILRNLEKGDDHGIDHDHDHDHGDDDSPLKLTSPIGMMSMKKEPVLGDEYANSPDVEMGQDNFPIDHGNDLHHVKGAYPKVAGGDNPMALENYKVKLQTMYEGLKNRS